MEEGKWNVHDSLIIWRWYQRVRHFMIIKCLMVNAIEGLAHGKKEGKRKKTVLNVEWDYGKEKI